MEVISLCGFLGAGKTTTLKHVLENCPEGIQIGVIANDVAAVNIDAQLISEATSENGDIVSVQLENGCACCSGSEGLIEGLESLVNSGNAFQYIVIESSGVAEAGQLRQVLKEAPCIVNKKAVIGPVVCILDSFDFIHVFKSKDNLGARKDLVGDTPVDNPTRLVVDLMVEQIESSDVVVLNKIELCDTVAFEEPVKFIRETIHQLNPRASILETSFGKLDILGMNVRQQHDHNHHHCCSATCNHSHATNHKDKYKISSFVYQATNGFHGPSLVENVLRKMSQIQSASSFPALEGFDDLNINSSEDSKTGEDVNPFGNVLRSKGFLYLDAQKSRKMYWSHAGRHFAVLPKGDWAADPARQEIVFIGVDMDQQAIEDLLNKSLVL